MKLWLSNILGALIVSNFVAMLVLGSAYLEADPVVTVKDEVWHDGANVPTLTFPPGSIAYLTRTVCSDKTVQVTIGRKIVCNNGAVAIPLESGAGELRGACQSYVAGVWIASVVPPSSCKYVVNLQETVNALRTTTKILESTPFEVR